MQERKQYQTITRNDGETERDKYTTTRMKEGKELLEGVSELISQENKADSYIQRTAQ